MKNSEPDKRRRHRWAAYIRLFVIRAKNNWLFLIVGLAAGLVIFSGTAIKAINDVVDIAFPRPDALSVAREGTRDQISREFIETTSRRIYWSRNFLSRIDRRAPSSEIHDSWVQLLRTIETMTARALIYGNLFEEFYGSARRNEFEYGIQTDFNKITTQIVDLRYSATVKKLEFPQSANEELSPAEATELKAKIDKLSQSLDELYVRIYLFTSCFEKKQKTSPTCQ